MRKALVLGTVFVFTTFVHAQQWQPAGVKILTPWGEQLDPSLPLNEYPRPQMQRAAWENLNGLWDYAIRPVEQANGNNFTAEGKILVPFAVESALSGVNRTVGKDSVLWYKRSFDIPAKAFRELKHKRLLLHFGAVDWRAEVFVNGKKAGQHEGGYDPFYFDITPFIQKAGKQELVVKVWDPTDDGPQPRGKQVKKPGGIWYTPVTGIWQTVWMETVPDTYIASIRQTPDVDNSSVLVKADVIASSAEDEIRVSIKEGENIIYEGKLEYGKETVIPIRNPQLWSPGQPFLYDIEYSLLKSGKVIDRVKGYFGMRKISLETDSKGIKRLKLNNEFLFQFGPLDQGWWPDGLYTAPTDEALRFDVVKTKEMGFNMIRKHVKVEPARWYYHCDREGILVWQDMPSGDLGNSWEIRPFILGRAKDKQRTPESENIFKTEWKAIINSLCNFPSIVVWVPFNEAWGQFKTEEIVQMTRNADPSRLINAASGGNFVHAGDIVDFHNYPEPHIPDPRMFGRDMAVVLGEYGGLGLPVQDHTWQQKNWGYQSFGTRDSLAMRYEEFIGRLYDFIPVGLSAAVYTQTTDVEGETNGLMTYDRKVFKIPIDRLRKAHMRLYEKKNF